MIKIVRTVFIKEDSPAGEVFTFDSGNDDYDCHCAGAFFIGRDLNNYLIVKNGYEVKDIISCEVSKITEKLMRKK